MTKAERRRLRFLSVRDQYDAAREEAGEAYDHFTRLRGAGADPNTLAQAKARARVCCAAMYRWWKMIDEF